MSNQPATPLAASTTSATTTTDGLPPIISEILSATPIEQSSGMSKRSQYDLLKSQIAPGCTDDELALFLHVARSRGLSPMLRQIHARKQRSWDNAKQDYVEKMIIMTSIDGLRLKAVRTGLHTRTSDAEFTHGAPVGPLNPAGIEKVTITVYRNTQAFAATVYWSELSQTYKKNNSLHLSSTWEKMPHGMLEKTCEAKALRRAFPEEIGDTYSEDEIGPDAAAPSAISAPPANGTGTASAASAAPTATQAVTLPKKDPPATTPEWEARAKEAEDTLRACKFKDELPAARKVCSKLLPGKEAPPALREKIGLVLSELETALPARPAVGTATTGAT